MTVMGVLWFAFIGTIAGLLAKFFYPRKHVMSWFETMALGIGGSFFGGWIGGLLGMGNGQPGGLFTATIGALLLLWIYNRLVRKR